MVYEAKIKFDKAELNIGSCRSLAFEKFDLEQVKIIFNRVKRQKAPFDKILVTILQN